MRLIGGHGANPDLSGVHSSGIRAKNCQQVYLLFGGHKTFAARWKAGYQAHREARVHEDIKAELIRAHVGNEADFPAEFRALMALPPERQNVIFQRLQVIDEYLNRWEHQTTAHADEAAERLGMKRRNFYKLLDKLRRFGPVRGLSKSYRAHLPAPSALGLSEAAERAIAKIMREDATAPLGKLQAAVEAATPKTEKAPSATAIRRRVNALRAPGGWFEQIGPNRKERVFGQAIVVDQTAVSLLIEGPSGLEYAVPTLIVDRETRLIIGLGLGNPSEGARGLEQALEDAERRQTDLPAGPFKLARRIREVSWVPPDGLMAAAVRWAEEIRPVVGTISHTGPRRHGSALLPLLGTKFAGFDLLPRMTSAPMVQSKQGMRPTVGRETARALLGGAVDHWNYEVARAWTGVATYADGDERRQHLQAWRGSAKARLIGDEIWKLFSAIVRRGISA